jgi:hypothetical protein
VPFAAETPAAREALAESRTLRGTAEQHIKEGKYAFRWTRLSCKIPRQ